MKKYSDNQYLSKLDGILDDLDYWLSNPSPQELTQFWDSEDLINTGITSSIIALHSNKHERLDAPDAIPLDIREWTDSVLSSSKTLVTKAGSLPDDVRENILEELNDLQI